MTEIFTPEWAARWRDELNASAEYRAAAADWEGSLAVVLDRDDGGGEAAVFLDLSHGSCGAARVASSDDLDRATYVLRAREKVWRRLFAGRMDPLFGLMLGQLRLERGDLSDLTHQAKAAQQLLFTAQRL
jgi:putative sterol carrier protein